MIGKNAVVAFSLSAAFLAFSPSAKAAGISVGTSYYMTVDPYSSGENNGAYYVGLTEIQIFTDTGGVMGTSAIETYDAFCMDFLDDISVPTTYVVEAQGVGTDFSSSVYTADGGAGNPKDPTDPTLELLAALGHGFSGVQSTDVALQDAIWEYTGAGSTYATGSTLATVSSDITSANITPYTGNAPAIAFLEQGGDGQTFMEVDEATPQVPPPSAVPEPSSLMLMGTGLIGLASALRRKLAIA